MIMSQNSIIKTENNGDYTFNSAILDENQINMSVKTFYDYDTKNWCF